jgi:hypothetical protein
MCNKTTIRGRLPFFILAPFDWSVKEPSAEGVRGHAPRSPIDGEERGFVPTARLS